MLDRPVISKHEIIADFVFSLVGVLIVIAAVFIFDIHWSFYPGETLLPPSRYIFTTIEPYLVGGLLGGLGGLFIFKLIFFAFAEERKAKKERKLLGRKQW